LTAQAEHLLPRAADVGANFGPEFDDRLMHLRFDVFLEQHFPIGHKLLDVGTQLARDWINDLKFFLDSEGKNVPRHFQKLAVRPQRR